MRFRGRGKSAPIMRLTDVIQRCYFQQVRFFIDLGIDLDEQNDDGRTSLILCALMEPEEWGVGIARLLIEKGAIVDTVDKYGLSAIHLACIYGRVELARVLLHAMDFDLGEGDKWGNTALHYAVRAGSVPLVRLLVHSHCKYKITTDKRNREGLSALDEARRLSHHRCAEIIASINDLSDSQIEALNPPPRLNLKMSRDSLHSISHSVSNIDFRQRPKTAFLTRRASLSSSRSSSSSSLYLAQRPIFVREFPGAKKDKMPNEKDFSQILRCASLSDFRNNPEYLYSLALPGVIPSNVNGYSYSHRPKSQCMRRPQSVTSEGPYFSWRVEFKKLFVHYESQCTPSYCEPAKFTSSDLPDIDGRATPQAGEDGYETDRGKKGKRSGSGKKEDKDRQRKHSNHKQEKQRKISQGHSHAHGKHSSNSLDGSLGSSTESLSSSGVATRKHGAPDPAGHKGSKDKHNSVHTGGTVEGHGRQSRVAHYEKSIPPVNVLGDDDVHHGKAKHAPVDHTRLKVS
ncbi:hypothetical protein FSP39_011580 [Pinctada imbricata]|uniref:Uncharacterized protein n=1 Tax=Pinctada imbricata TaxID=66713 RepID=A0AA89BQL8_PINIB|nr:hypothetical protein FSP39_011580 [Pinctada imbricata]